MSDESWSAVWPRSRSSRLPWWYGSPRQRAVVVLHDDRHAAERTVGRGCGVVARALVARVDDRVERRVARLDARSMRGVDELGRG